MKTMSLSLNQKKICNKLMVKYHYPFQFDFDYDLFLHDANQLSKHQIKHTRTGTGADYKKAENGDEITSSAYKIPLYKIKSLQDNKHCISIINQCKKLFDAIGSKDNNIILVEYDDNSFLGWHIDPGSTEYGRINCILTPNYESSPIIFKDGNNEVSCPAKLAVVNAYRVEHRYDNRGKEKRILLIMTTHDLNFEECIDAVKRL